MLIQNKLINQQVKTPYQTLFKHSASDIQFLKINGNDELVDIGRMLFLSIYHMTQLKAYFCFDPF